jgi:T5SS/PEP-CTERM-associated repeat protein
VAGSKSRWDIDGNLDLSVDGREGSLEISQGGSVSAGNANIGDSFSMFPDVLEGKVEVRNAGSSFNVIDTLRIGQRGWGRLDVLGGSSVSSGTVIFGDKAGSFGRA